MPSARASPLQEKFGLTIESRSIKYAPLSGAHQGDDGLPK
jgi:hypothetical protein